MTTTWPDPRDLSAVSVPVDDALPADLFDLVTGVDALLSGPELTLLGCGTAATLTLAGGLDGANVREAAAWLAQVPHDVQPGVHRARVTALGALPFEREAEGRLVVPELLVGLDVEGDCWLTTLGPPGRSIPTAAALVASARERSNRAARTPLLAPAGLDREDSPVAGARSVERIPDADGYRQCVGSALARIQAGSLSKVVLARSLIVRLANEPSLTAILKQLRADEPGCVVFSFPTPHGTFFGASPELLVRRRGRDVTAVPLAGTMATGPGPAGSSSTEHPLTRSDKDRLEHDFVVDAVVAALAPHCERVALPEGTVLVTLGSLVHLGTRVSGTLRSGSEQSALELAAALHPTPAVGGVPREAALRVIATLEPRSREHWAGPVGWVDATGDGDWMIGIRSATVEGATVTLTAGAGIVEGSDPDEELQETSMKLRPLVDACCPGIVAP
ncbi:MAG: isochorismate synthase [Actinomycetota bacterium]|jgi:isochorismate synthase|nr:isochorismate synthase [Actinomycetota bacterium]